MPPAIIAAAAAVASWAVTTYVTSVILATILLVAISVATSVLIAKLTKQRLNQGQELKLKIDSSMPRQIAVGRTATGGSLVWAFTYTDNSKKPNRYLVRIIALSDLPINGVVAIKEGNNTLTFSGDVTTGLRACNQHRTKKNAAAFWVKIIKGSPTATADSDIMAMAGGWTSNHKGTNIAYMVQKSDYDADAFPNGEPQLTVTVDGVSVYDCRADSTVSGGSGSQRLATPSTWTFSRNAAVIATQLLRGFYSKGVLLCGAQALPTDFRTSNLMEAADLCDATVGSNGGNRPAYQAGMMINSEESVANFLVDLQSAFDGNIADRGGVVTLLPGASRTPVFTLTDADIIPTEQRSWQPYAPLGQLTNHILGTFADEANGYTEKAFPTQKNAQWEIDDGGERFSAQYAFRAVTNGSQVQRITRRMHQATRYQGTGAFVLPIWALELEQYDWFVWQSDRFNFTKTFIAAKVDITQDLKIAVVCAETPATFSDWDHVTHEVDPNDTTGSYPGPQLVVPDYALTPAVRLDAPSKTEYIVMDIAVTGIEDGAEATTFEVEFAKSSALGTTWSGGTYNSINQTVTLWNLLPNTSYAVRLRSSDGMRFSDWSDWEYATTGTFTYSVADILDSLDDAFAAAAAKGRLFFRSTAPSVSESSLGDTWIDDDGVFHDRVNEGGILLGGNAITLGGFRPFIAWTPSPYQPLDTNIKTSNAALGVANDAYAAANEAIDALDGLADDGVLTQNEKITKLIPESVRLDTKWATLSEAADLLSVSTTSVDAARSAWLAFLAGLSPAWNDVSTDTLVTRSTYNGLRDAYDGALYDLNKAVSEEASKRALWTGVTGPAKPEDNADVTANAQIVVVPPTTITINRTWDGQVKAGQLPKTARPAVTKGGVDIRDDNNVSYSVSGTGGIAGKVTVNNTNGSPSKGDWTIDNTVVTGGSVIETVTVGGVTIGAFTTLIVTSDDNPPSSSGAGGGTDTTFPAITSTSYATMTTTDGDDTILDVILSGSGGIKLTAVLSYQQSSNLGTLAMTCKGEYSPDEGTNWYDMDSSTGEYTGTGSYRTDDPPEEVEGWLSATWTKTSLGAGTYKIRLRGKKASSVTGSLIVLYGTATSAKI